MNLLGIIGYPLSHSFSKQYFTQKFENQGLTHDWKYETFSIEDIEKLTDLLRGQPDLVGLNVTIPFKKLVIPFLDEIDDEAREIGAVNCIKIKNGKLKGYNTDVYGFEKSLLGLLEGQDLKALSALILGTGGAAKAAEFTLKKLKIPFLNVSRTRTNDALSYEDLDENIYKTHKLIINTTPLGMSPNTEGCPNINFQYIDNQCFMYDLIYNPEETTFLRLGKERGAKIKNGMDMLLLQAEKGWEIWRFIG